jgi:hypothetical protein
MAEDAGRKDGSGDEPPLDDFDESDIRRELGEVLDRISALPSDAIRERVALAARQEELRAALAKVPIPGSDQIKERWSEQSGSKLSEDEAHPVISPGAVRS